MITKALVANTRLPEGKFLGLFPVVHEYPSIGHVDHAEETQMPMTKYGMILANHYSQQVISAMTEFHSNDEPSIIYRMQVSRKNSAAFAREPNVYNRRQGSSVANAMYFRAEGNTAILTTIMPVNKDEEITVAHPLEDFWFPNIRFAQSVTLGLLTAVLGQMETVMLRGVPTFRMHCVRIILTDAWYPVHPVMLFMGRVPDYDKYFRVTINVTDMWYKVIGPMMENPCLKALALSGRVSLFGEGTHMVRYFMSALLRRLKAHAPMFEENLSVEQIKREIRRPRNFKTPMTRDSFLDELQKAEEEQRRQRQKNVVNL
jgi:hypothetical protein